MGKSEVRVGKTEKRIVATILETQEAFSILRSGNGLGEREQVLGLQFKLFRVVDDDDIGGVVVVVVVAHATEFELRQFEETPVGRRIERKAGNGDFAAEENPHPHFRSDFPLSQWDRIRPTIHTFMMTLFHRILLGFIC